MPTIEGSVEEAGRIIVVDENTGGIDSNTVVASGTYSVSSSSLDPKIVLFRRGSDGNTLGYSGITSLDDTPFLGSESVFVDGVDTKMFGHQTGIMIGNSRCLCTFRNQSPMHEYYTIGTISGQSINFTTPVNFTNSEVSVNYKPFLGYDSTYNKVLFFASYFYKVGTIDGDTINFGPNILYSSFTIDSYFHVTYNELTHTALILYRSGNSLRSIAATFDGSTLSFGSYDATYPMAVIGCASCYDSSTDKYCVIMNPDNGGAYITMLSITGNTISSPYSNLYVCNNARFNPTCCYVPSRNIFFVSVWRDLTSDRNYLYSYSWNNSNNTFSKLHEYSGLYSSYSAFPTLIYDTETDKLLVDLFSGGSTSRINLFEYSLSTGFSTAGTVDYYSGEEYNNSVLLNDQDTNKKIVLYGKASSYVGAAKVFRL